MTQDKRPSQSRRIGRTGRAAVGALLAGFAFCGALPCQAAKSTTTFKVQANVLAVCTVTATNLNFGDYNASLPVANTSNSTLSVTCSNGQSYSIALDAGISAGAAVNARAMSSGAEVLPYALYTTSARTTIWGDGTSSTAAVAGKGTGSAQTVTVYGRIPEGQHVASGSYADTITVTLTY